MRLKWFEYLSLIFVLWVSGMALITAPSPSNELNQAQAAQKIHSLDLTRAIGQSFPGLDSLVMTTPFSLPYLDDLSSLPSSPLTGLAKDEQTYMIPQGLVVMERYLIMSTYSGDGSHQSLLYLWDRWTGQAVGSVILPGRIHAGGLAYDTKHRTLWLAYKDEERSGIAALTLEHLLLYLWSQPKEAISLDKFVAIEGMDEVSYLTYQNDVLYVGYFDVAHPGLLAAYPLTSQGDIGANPSQTWETPKKVQGLTFYPGLFVFSVSYGNHSSKLVAYQMASLKEKRLLLENAKWVLALPPYLEQTAVCDGKLLLLFESAGILYRVRPGVVPLDQILALDLSRVDQLAKKIRSGDIKSKEMPGIVVYS